MALWPKLPDILSDPKLPEPFDQPGTQDKGEHKSGQSGINGPKRNIAKDIEYGVPAMERVQQMIEHDDYSPQYKGKDKDTAFIFLHP
jgi:hypothetical protein